MTPVDEPAAVRAGEALEAGRLGEYLVRHLPGLSLPLAALIHNDYKLDNVVFDASAPARLIGVLDWEMATIGDPAMDLGCALAYWIEAGDDSEMLATRMLLTHLPGALSRAEVIERYARQSGRALPDFRFHRVFGLFRLAVIVQQIYRRFERRETRDARFGALGPMARTLIARAAAEIGAWPRRRRPVQRAFSAHAAGCRDDLRTGASCRIDTVCTEERGDDNAQQPLVDRDTGVPAGGHGRTRRRHPARIGSASVRRRKMHRALRHRVGQVHAGRRGRHRQDAGLRRQVQRVPASLRSVLKPLAPGRRQPRAPPGFRPPQIRGHPRGG
jgi:hypothetical protein